MADDKTTDAPAAEEEKKEIPKKFEKIVKEISEMSVLDLSELVSVLEDHFGVSAAAPAVAVAAAPGAGGDDGGDDTKSEYTVVLKDAGAQKIAVIKAVKEVTGLGLGEAKGLVDGAPGNVKEAVPADEAEDMKKKIEEAGGTVELV